MDDTERLVEALNRIADEIAAHLAWMREQKAKEDANRTRLPSLDYESDINRRMLNGRWPKRDGNSYGQHPEPEVTEIELRKR